MAQPTVSIQGEPHWWQQRWFLLLLILASAIPLMVPHMPPLIDLPGHLGRYRVQLDIDTSPTLRNYYSFQWSLIGNLGIDLLIIPLSKLFGLELAVKLIVMAVPPLTVAGFLGIAREIHGRVPGSAFFALPLAYGYPFQFGFTNFVLAMALTFCAFALWLRLARLGRLRLRAILFVPLACVIWICHAFGWALLCLLAFAAEIANARDRGAGYVAAIFRGGIACLPLAPPILLMIMWRSEPVAGTTGDWFDWRTKGRWLVGLLRERYELWDRACAILVMLIPLTAIFWRQIRFSHKLGLATLFLMLAFILLPRVLLGSAYADMRLSPYLFAVAILALGPIGDFRLRYSGWIAAAGLAFFAARLAVTTVAFAEIDRIWRTQLAAVDHIAQGSRILVLAETACNGAWKRDRVEHLGSFAIARRHAFTNDQWVMPGAQLLRVRYWQGYPFAIDASEILRPAVCAERGEGSLRRALEVLPRGAFDYLWLIDVPAWLWPQRPWLEPVWHARRGVLYRLVGSASSASETPNGREARPRI